MSPGFDVAGGTSALGFFPITGDPIHWAHLRAAQKAVETLRLGAVYIQVCGDLPDHKPDKLPAHHRHEMARRAVDTFDARVRYTSLGIGTVGVGEDVFIEFTRLFRCFGISKFYYLAGADNLQTVLGRFAQNRLDLDVDYEIVFFSRDGCAVATGHPVIVCDYQYSSSLFRAHKNTEGVPPVVLRYCQEHHLYGF